MVNLSFARHARREMARDNNPVEAVYHVVGDADEVIVQDNGRTAYAGTWEGRAIGAVVDADGRTVVTAWERKQDSRRARRRRRG